MKTLIFLGKIYRCGHTGTYCMEKTSCPERQFLESVLSTTISPKIHPRTCNRPRNNPRLNNRKDLIFVPLPDLPFVQFCWGGDLHNLKGRHHLWSSRYLQSSFKFPLSQVSWNDYISNMCKWEIFTFELLLMITTTLTKSHNFSYSFSLCQFFCFQFFSFTGSLFH